MVTSQAQKLQAQIDSFKKNMDNGEIMDREVTMLGLDSSSLPQPILTPNQIPKQYISEELQIYLQQSSEDEKVINNVEWLIKQFITNLEIMAMDVLKPILDIINPRATIISAIHTILTNNSLKQQKALPNGQKVQESSQSLDK